MTDVAEARDSPQDRIAKLLPGDVTAAFLSAKAALIAVVGEDSAPYVFWTFVAIVILCPWYFWFVSRAKNLFHVTFLTLSFVVFAISIASTEFTAYFNTTFKPTDFEPIIQPIAIVVPILWTYLIAQISVAALNSSGSSAPVLDKASPKNTLSE